MLVTYNMDAEAGLLGSILIEGDLIKEVQLQPEHFYIDKHKTIYRAMKELEKKDTPIDIVTVTTQLGEKAQEIGITYMADLQSSVPSTETYKTYEKLIMDAWKIRQTIMLTNSFREIAATSNDTSNISELIKELSAIEELGYNDDFDLKRTLMNVWEKLETPTEGIRGVDTGFADLNMITHGWKNGDLVILAARPSMGKTAFALNQAINACEKDTVVTLFSLEMSDESILNRIMSAVGRIDATRMENASKYFQEEDWRKATQAVSRINNFNLNIYDKSGVTVQEIRAKARKIKRKYPDKKHLLIIDYLQLIQGTGKENRQQEVSDISRSLKILARDLDLPIICLSQLSRNVEQRADKRPMLSDLRESGSIEQDADLVLFLYRDDYYDSASDKKNITEVLVRKHRNGPTGLVELCFMKNYNLFVNLDRNH